MTGVRPIFRADARFRSSRTVRMEPGNKLVFAALTAVVKGLPRITLSSASSWLPIDTGCLPEPGHAITLSLTASESLLNSLLLRLLSRCSSNDGASPSISGTHGPSTPAKSAKKKRKTNGMKFSNRDNRLALKSIFVNNFR
jgi:hypothetical protein